MGRAYARDRERNPKRSDKLNYGGARFFVAEVVIRVVMERLSKTSVLMMIEVRRRRSWSEFRWDSR